MAKEIIKVPDLGGADAVEVIEVCVSAGDIVDQEDSLFVVESDKASMDLPSPFAGKVLAVLVSEGDEVKEGDNLIELEIDSEGAAGSSENGSEVSQEKEEDVAAVQESQQAQAVEDEPKPASQAAVQSAVQLVNVPDIGTEEAVEIIELCVADGDDVEEGDSLVVLESDKASMEIPAPFSGKVIALKVAEGASVKQGDALMEMASVSASSEQSAAPEPAPMSTPSADAKQTLVEPKQVSEQHQPVVGMTENRPSGDVYAGPAVRKMAREIGLDLTIVPGSGPKGRIQKSDVKSFIKDSLSNKRSVPVSSATGAGIPEVPAIDFSQFGDVTIEKMSKLHKVTAANMHRSWLNVPHVTAFDEVDITDLEDFRKSMKAEAEKAGVKLTPLPFLLKACAAALKANPKLNASLHSDGESMVYKNYVHIGIAVDTPAGLMVPVIRDVDKKSMYELAAEATELAAKAKERKLKPAEMQGGSFTISSLGSMGGTGFTPIVNTPEVAILGVSKLDVKPRWNGDSFEPRKMLPISLSYDHRAVNGADAGRFMVFLNAVLSDIRRLAL